MIRFRSTAACMAVLLAALAPLPALADFEVAAPDGRRILLKDNGTWSYLAGEKPKEEEPKPTIVVTGEGVLTLERMDEQGPNCTFGFRLKNDTNFEIRNIVPRFVVYRTNGIAYEARTLAFYSINPGNSLYRQIMFRGITCKEIGRVEVTGGDRCVMGDLDKFSYTGGACLDRVRVVPSDFVRFEK